MALTLDAYNVASNSFNDTLRNLNSINETRLQDEERKRRFLLDRMKYDTTIGDAERQKLKKQLDDGFGITGAIKSMFTTADPSEVANTTDLQRAEAMKDAGLTGGDASSAWVDKVVGLTEKDKSSDSKKRRESMVKSADGLYMTDGKIYKNIKDGKPEGAEDFVTDQLNDYEVIDGKRYKKTEFYNPDSTVRMDTGTPDGYNYKEMSDKDVELEGKRALKDIKDSKDYYFDKEKGRWYRKSSNDQYSDTYTPGEVGLGDIKYKDGVDTSKDIQKMKDQAYAEDKKANPEKYERKFVKGDMNHYRAYAEEQGIYTDKFTGSKAEQIGQNQRLYENLIAEAVRRGDYDTADRFNREYKANLMNIDKYWGDDRGGKYEDLWVRPREEKRGNVKYNNYTINITNKKTGETYPETFILSDEEARDINGLGRRAMENSKGSSLDGWNLTIANTSDYTRASQYQGEGAKYAKILEDWKLNPSKYANSEEGLKSSETGIVVIPNSYFEKKQKGDDQSK